MRIPDRNEQNRHMQPVISRLGLRENESFLEIQVVGLAILRRDMGAIGDLDPIAMRLEFGLTDQIGALADVPPFCDLGESPDPVLLFAIGIDCVFDEFKCISNGLSVDVDPHAAR